MQLPSHRLECLRHRNVPGFSAVIFRRNSTQVRNPGGLWDTSCELFAHAKGAPKESTLEWNFQDNGKVKFAHLEHDKVTRALPASSQAEAGNIKILQAPWNEDFFRELENFPEGGHDDIVDALSGAFLLLNESAYDLNALMTL